METYEDIYAAHEKADAVYPAPEAEEYWRMLAEYMVSVQVLKEYNYTVDVR
jgi:hypothetical protein